MTGLSVVRGVFLIVPATILVTISFFVLVTARKVEGEVLKAFGYVIAVFLWISALFLLSVGFYMGVSGNKFISPFMCMGMENSGRHGMMQRNPDFSMRDQMMKQRGEPSKMDHDMMDK